MAIHVPNDKTEEFMPLINNSPLMFDTPEKPSPCHTLIRLWGSKEELDYFSRQLSGKR